MASTASEKAAAGMVMEGVEAAADLSDGGFSTSSSSSGEELEQLDFGDSDDWGGEATQDEEEEEETDPARLLQRQKQVDYGKNTIGYERYVVAVPKDFRKRKGKDNDPPTPDIKKKMTKRTWDGIVKVWRRHLHKFEDLGLTDAEAHAAELKARVLATRQAKAQAAAEARAAAKRKSKADAAGGKEMVSLAEKKRHRRLAAQARQQRQQQQQKKKQRGQGQEHEVLPVLPKAQHASTHTPKEQQHHQDQPAKQSLAEPQQQQQQQQQQDGSREWGSADKQDHSISRSGRPDSRQRYGRADREREGDREGRSAAAHGSRGDSERDKEREGRGAGAYGGSSSGGDREQERGQARDRSSPSRDRQREREREAGRSSRDGRGYGASGRQADSSYSRRSRDHDWRQAGRHDDSRQDRAAAADRDRDSSRQQFKWQVVEDRAGWPTRSSDKENSRGGYGGGSSSRGATAAGKGRGDDDDTRFYDRSFGSRSSRPNRAEQEPAPGAAAAVAAAVKGLDTHNSSSRARAGQQLQTRPQPADKPPTTTPLASRRYSSLRQQLAGGSRGRASEAAGGASDSDAPNSPLRQPPVSLLAEDFMDWADGTPSCPDRKPRGRAAHASWADDVEAAEVLSNVCEVMMVMGHASSPLPAPGSKTAAAAAAAAGGQMVGRQDSMELEEGEIGGDDDVAAAAGTGGQQGGGGSSAALRPKSAGFKRTAVCLG